MKESKDQKKSLNLDKKIDIYEDFEEDIKEFSLSLEDKVRC